MLLAWPKHEAGEFLIGGDIRKILGQLVLPLPCLERRLGPDVLTWLSTHAGPHKAGAAVHRELALAGQLILGCQFIINDLFTSYRLLFIVRLAYSVVASVQKTLRGKAIDQAKKHGRIGSAGQQATSLAVPPQRRLALCNSCKAALWGL